MQEGDKNIIYVGKKDTMAYVLAVISQLNQGIPEIHVKARGRSISKAVDITQIVKNRFMPNMLIKSIDVSTEDVASDDGRMSKVSSMDITISKP
ncbi:MAG: DNA-binding protein Alba [Candidatus Micrarchaeota archaeon]